MTALVIQSVEHNYGERVALRDVSFDVASGTIFGLLGPNGGGKTTLFRLVATLLPLQSGDIRVGGCSVRDAADLVRRQLGVTFQSPSLDVHLTVRENLVHHGHLYGWSGEPLRVRIDELAARFGLTHRLRDRVKTLSGGLARRVEVAKSLLHRPSLLLLDEPSTGLDPGARHDLWNVLRQLSTDEGVTVVVTTHLMEEAERCDQLALLHRGRLVAQGTPDGLRHELGTERVTITTASPAAAERLAERWSGQAGLTCRAVGHRLHLHGERLRDTLPEWLQLFGADVPEIALTRPTLEDVFIARTGDRLDQEPAPAL